MKITFDEWKKIDAAAKAARKALEQLDSVLTGVLAEHMGKGHAAEVQMLCKTFDSVQNAYPYLHGLLLQEEWLGGDSSDPNNFGWREPNCVSHGHLIPGTRGVRLDDR
jgi:hypothetical protein